MAAPPVVATRGVLYASTPHLHLKSFRPLVIQIQSGVRGLPIWGRLARTSTTESRFLARYTIVIISGYYYKNTLHDMAIQHRGTSHATRDSTVGDT